MPLPPAGIHTECRARCGQLASTRTGRSPSHCCVPAGRTLLLGCLGPQAEPSEEERGSESCSVPDVALRAYVNHFRFNLW